jgi:SAM domain (Sterile alpha motif)
MAEYTAYVRLRGEDHESGAAWYMAMNVGDWLRSLGLGKYEARFRDSEIDSDILHELTESDLEKLGVPLGHRKRLLKAIAGLGAAATAPSTATLRLDADAAERRHLTVMFIDLVGSSALSTKLDPEDLGGVIGTYHRCCAELVERNGGFGGRWSARLFWLSSGP